jgi:hypothetical protein
MLAKLPVAVQTSRTSSGCVNFQNFQWLCKLPELPVAVWTSSGCANFQNFQWLCELPAAVQTSRTSSGCANFQNFQWLCELPAAVQTSRTSSGCVDFQWLCSAQVKGLVVRACGGTSKGGRLCGWCGYGKVDYKAKFLEISVPKVYRSACCCWFCVANLG